VRAQQDRIRAETAAIKAKARLDLEAFASAFAGGIAADIDKATADDVRRYLEDYVKDTFKAWAEAEGDALAALLEALAEEIIQVTNENIHAVMETLGAQLGAATRVDIDVDLFKYDLATLALGAFGTTIFLFVNTLVGGLLTLAAPVLAIVLKERAQSEVKAQAALQAPQVIRAAAAALAPRFEEAIDGFGDRLSDFVVQAGETLERGVSEILEEALRERKATAEDRATREREIDAQAERLAAITADLEAVRQEVWQEPPAGTPSP